MDEISKREDSLFEHVSKLIDEARKHVKTTIDTTMVYTYYGVGKYIVVDEQQGYARAKYGKTVLRNLSKKLTERYGKGWSVETLTAARKFYQIYSEGKIANTVYEIQENADIHFTLSWSHYLILMRIANQNVIFMRLNATSRIGVSDNYSGSTTPASMSDGVDC